MDVIKNAYEIAKERYAAVGIDTDAVIAKVAAIPLSIHCWQADDVGGFEVPEEGASADITVTGGYMGKATKPEELMADFKKAISLIPGKKKLNLHASYALTDGVKVGRDAIEPKHFAPWVDYAKKQNIGLDMNPTFFSHPKAASGLTLSDADEGIRAYWIEHAIRTRVIGAYMGKELGQPCVNNLWVQDGYKDTPADRLAPRARLKDSLDKIFAADVDKTYNRDAVECKLFGIGTEAYVVGSMEFYANYTMHNKDVMLTLDLGHFHPTESVADKLSSALLYNENVLFHLSRPMRWDSDHVLANRDDLNDVFSDMVRSGYFDRVFLSLDFFDASINRIAAWVIGARNAQRAMIRAMLEPVATIKACEAAGDFTSRLALTEEFKSYPWSAVFDYYCLSQDIPVGSAWLDEVKAYEKDVLAKR